VLEPRRIAFGRACRTALLRKLHRTVRGAEAQARARVDDHAKPVVARKVVAPLPRLVAVEHAQEFACAVAREHGFDLARQRERLRRGPGRQEPGVHEDVVLVDRHERPSNEPRYERIAIRRCEDVVQRIAAMRLAIPRRDGQEMEVVIAEDRGGGVAHRHHVPQHCKRARPAVDEVADEPQAIARRVEADEIEEIAKFAVTALDVADRVERHDVCR